PPGRCCCAVRRGRRSYGCRRPLADADTQTGLEVAEPEAAVKTAKPSPAVPHLELARSLAMVRTGMTAEAQQIGGWRDRGHRCCDNAGAAGPDSRVGEGAEGTPAHPLTPWGAGLGASVTVGCKGCSSYYAKRYPRAILASGADGKHGS